MILMWSPHPHLMSVWQKCGSFDSFWIITNMLYITCHWIALFTLYTCFLTLSFKLGVIKWCMWWWSSYFFHFMCYCSIAVDSGMWLVIIEGRFAYLSFYFLLLRNKLTLNLYFFKTCVLRIFIIPIFLFGTIFT